MGSDEVSEHYTLNEEPQRNEWLGIVVRLLVAAVVLVGAYLGVAHYLGGRLPSGTSVAGYDVGSLTPEDARRTLESKLRVRAEEPVVVTLGPDSYRLAPADAGLTFDLDTTLSEVTGVDYDPRVMWRRITGDGDDLPLAVDVDRAQLEAAVSGLSEQIDVPAAEGGVTLQFGEVQVKEPVVGRALDVARTVSAIEGAWPETTEVEAVTGEVAPQLSAEEITRFTEREARPALAGPIVVKVAGAQARLTPTQLSRMLTVEQSPDHRLSLKLDDQAVVRTVRGSAGRIETRPQNYRLALVDGKPKVLPGKQGRRINDKDLIRKVRGVLDGGPRTVTVRTTPIKPEVTLADSRAWDVGQELSHFVSEFPTGPENEARTTNIRVGLGHVNGTVVMPGDQFSLGDAISPITEDRGYVRAGVIADGRLVHGLGGGLSQVSTTVLNTAWEAGVQLDEFTPHSYYISRYPVGREATISLPSIDNKWTNDTKNPIVIQTWITGNEIHMRFWGKRELQVETITGPRRNIEQPGRDTDDSPNCLPQHAQEGFDITVTRVLSRAGKEVDREEYKTHYHSSPEVVCTGG